MSLLQITVGAVAIHRDRLVVICSTDETGRVRVRDLVSNQILDARVSDLSARETPESERRSAQLRRDLADASPEQLGRARFRHRCVLAALTADQPISRAVQQVAKVHSVSSRTLWRWVNRYRGWPSLDGLLFRNWGVQSGQRRLASDVESIIHASIDDVYLTQPKGSYVAVVEDVWRRCRQAHLPLPSRNAVVRRIRSLDPWIVARHQVGRREADRQFGYKPGALREKTPLGLVQIDHTLVDVHVVDDAHRESIGRPWITVAVDVATRCVLGFHLSLESPSVASVAACLSRACLPKERWLESLGVSASWPVWGIPTRLHADNAREFKTEALGRGCAQWNIEMSWRPVGRPHYGGHIERLIGTLMGRVHLLPGSSQSNPGKRGRYPSERKAQLTMAELEKWLVLEICERYQLSVHRALRKAPLHAWQDWFAAQGTHPAIPGDLEAFRISFLPMIVRSLTRQGIVFNGIHYWDSVLPAISSLGQKLSIRYDPNDLSRIFVHDQQGAHHPVPYADLTQPAITLAEAKSAMKTLDRRERGRGAAARIVQAAMRQRELIEQSSKATRAQRRTRQRTAEAKRQVGRPPLSMVQASEINFDVDPPDYPVEIWDEQ